MSEYIFYTHSVNCIVKEHFYFLYSSIRSLYICAAAVEVLRLYNGGARTIYNNHFFEIMIIEKFHNVSLRLLVSFSHIYSRETVGLACLNVFTKFIMD